MIPFLTAFVLGLLTILDPCTLLTSFAAIGFIDRDLLNRRRVLFCSLSFVFGKLVTYMLLAIPFLMGAETELLSNFLSTYGEPILAGMLIVTGVALLVAGRNHHVHDHGISSVLSRIDNENSIFWSFLLGIFFAIAFCPHRLIYFLTMIDLALKMPVGMAWLMPFVYALATGLPIMLVALLLSYTAVSLDVVKDRLSAFSGYLRLACAILFIGVGIWLYVEFFLPL